jgi:hypothetical protein
MVAQNATPRFPPEWVRRFPGPITWEKTDREVQATLVKWMRDPRSGEVHLPNEEVTVMGFTRNLDRTSLKV